MKVEGYHVSNYLATACHEKISRFHYHARVLTENNAVRDTDIVVCTVSSIITKSILDKFDHLKGIVTASTGVDHIDIDACHAKGITVLNCDSYAANSVAELGIAMALIGLRQLNMRLTEGKVFSYLKEVSAHEGEEVQNKRCCVIGVGNVGQLITKKLLALGCEVFAYSNRENKALIQLGVNYLSLHDALTQSELIFLSLPLNETTFHFLGDINLSLLNNHVGIINVGRGGLIDNNALLNHMNRFMFVATDVIEAEADLMEGKDPDEILKKLGQFNNFILLPHLGASTTQARERLVKEVIENIKLIESKE